MKHDEQPGWARRTAASIAQGTLSAEAVARDTLARIAAADVEVRAFVCTLSAEAAVAQARQSSGPLAGLPVAVKDIFDTRELPTAYGSPIYPAQPASSDAAIVSVLRGAGGLAIGKSTTTEFAFLHPTVTRNPAAPGRTPGGSSAGSAAAVAAGLVPLGIGTQTAGSVIRPASYCGVVGYKPSFGWLPTEGLKCFSWSLDTVGLFARDVADVSWFAQALCGRALVVEGDAPRVPASIGVPDAYPWGEPSASAHSAIALGARVLESQGVEVRTLPLPAWSADLFEAHVLIQGYEAWRCLGWEYAHHRHRLSAELRDYLEGSRDISASQYEAAQIRATQARAEVPAWLGSFDALLTPSAPDEAPEGYASTGASTFNRLWTLLGLPCISVPGALGTHGAPMGLQLIGRWGDDSRLLALAHRLEQALRKAATRAD